GYSPWDALKWFASEFGIEVPQQKKFKTDSGKTSPWDQREPPPRTEADAPAEADNEWDPPIPFTAFDLPSFPVGALPPVLAEFVKGEAVATQTPADLAALLVLAACATALSKRAIVHINDGYREPLNLYCVGVLPPGERKSAV